MTAASPFSISQSTETFRIAVVDDHSIMRSVYRSLVEDTPGMIIAWSASNLEEARLHLERDDKPDVMILDLTLPDGTGYELAREVLKQYPKLSILMVSAYQDKSYAQEAAECGARGYLVKDSSTQELLEALEAVLAGERYFKPAID